MSIKLAILSPDAKGTICGVNQAQLFQHLNLVPLSDADAVIIPVSRFANFEFNTELEKIKKPMIVIDYIEIAWNYFESGRNSFIFGQGEDVPDELITNENWCMLHGFLKAHPPVLTMKRELLEADHSRYVRPIEYLCTHPAPPIQTREEFNARPFDVFSSWGYSNPQRPRIHGEIFNGMGTRGFNTVSDWCQLENMPAHPKTWCSIYSPYWARKPISEIMAIQQKAKISLSLFGAGRKSFRDAEAPVGAIMARPKDDMAYSFPWTDSNSIIMPIGSEVAYLDGILSGAIDVDLYADYLTGQANVENYRISKYREYVLRCIKECL